MNKILSLSVISTKLVFLACFSLMGVFPLSSAAAEVVPPCHQMAMEVETQEPEEGCQACDISQEGWELQLVSPSLVENIKCADLVAFLPGWEEFFADVIEEVIVLSVNDPPDIEKVLHAELIVKNSTVFIL